MEMFEGNLKPTFGDKINTTKLDNIGNHANLTDTCLFSNKYSSLRHEFYKTTKYKLTQIIAPTLQGSIYKGISCLHFLIYIILLIY